MKSDLLLLGLAGGIRAFGFFLFQGFLSLYLLNVLGLDAIYIGALILGFGVVPLLLSPFGGLLTDRYGRRRLLLLGLAGEAGGALLLAYGMSLQSLVIISAAVSMSFVFGQALGPPANSAYVADLAQGAERTKGFTWLRVGFNAGAGAGVAVGGILIGTIGFPWVAALASVSIAAATVLVAALLHPSPYDVQLAARRHRKGATSAPSPGSEASADGAAQPSMRHSLHLLVADRRFLEMCLAFAVGGIAAGQWAVTFVLYANVTLGVPYYALGLGLAINCVIVVFCQTLTTHAVLGRRHTWVGGIGVVLYVIAFLVAGAAGQWSIAPAFAFVFAVVVSTTGENFVMVPMTTLPSNMAPEKEIGNYNAAFQTVTGAAWLGSVFIGGIVLTAVPGPMLQWTILMVPAIPSLLLLAHVSRKIPEAMNRA